MNRTTDLFRLANDVIETLDAHDLEDMERRAVCQLALNCFDHRVRRDALAARQERQLAKLTRSATRKVKSEPTP